MAFQTLTLPELVERARQAFRTELPGSDAWLWPNNVNVSSKVMGGMTHLNLLWLAYIAKQRWVSTADGEFLDKHGFVYGIPRLPATYAKGSVTMTGVAGTTVPSGLKLSLGDGRSYTTTSDATVDGIGSVTLSVQADEAGSDGNALAATPVSLSAAFTGLDGTGVVSAAGIGLGADAEGDESYRARLLWRLRMPPMGGAAHDYVAWAREIGGVTRVFVDPLASGPGTVAVYFLMDDTYVNGIPQAADVSAVQAYINSVRPVTAVVTVSAPSPVAINITINNLSPNTTAVREAIQLELADLFYRDVPVSTGQAPFTLYRSKIIEAISQAAGEEHHIMTAPASDVSFSAGQIGVLGSITYT